MTDPEPTILQKWNQLHEYLGKFDRIGVALSGGVDSALMCAAAVQTIGKENVTAFTINSTMERQRETDDSRVLANQLGVNHVLIHFDELKIPDISANPPNRCYFCKLHRLKKIMEYATTFQIDLVVDGSNEDDLGDYRPGRKALTELGVQSPLANFGITKREVRQLAKWQGLPVWDKPSTPCLATRLPYGMELTEERIRKVTEAEDVLQELGFTDFRVRYHETVARVEVPPETFEKVLANKEIIVEKIMACGFQYVTLDLLGFRSGSMNEGLEL